MYKIEAKTWLVQGAQVFLLLTPPHYPNPLQSKEEKNTQIINIKQLNLPYVKVKQNIL